MSDLPPPPDRLRDALRQAGQAWVPTRPPSEARARLLAGLERRRRHRNNVLLSAGAALMLALLLAPMVVARDDGRRLLVQGGTPARHAPGDGSRVPGGPGDVSTGEGATGRQARPAGGQAAPDTADAPGDKIQPAPKGAGEAGASSTSTTTDGPDSPAATSPVSTEPVETSEPVVIATDSGIKGTVRISPVCPVERDPPDPACAPRPATADIRILRNGAVIARGRADDDGAFRISVGPGHYAVEATRAGPAVGSGCQAEPGEVDVASGRYATVSVMCDTGIR